MKKTVEKLLGEDRAFTSPGLDASAEAALKEAAALINQRLQAGAKMTPQEQVIELAIALLERVDGTGAAIDVLTELGLGLN